MMSDTIGECTSKNKVIDTPEGKFRCIEYRLYSYMDNSSVQYEVYYYYSPGYGLIYNYSHYEQNGILDEIILVNLD